MSNSLGMNSYTSGKTSNTKYFFVVNVQADIFTLVKGKMPAMIMKKRVPEKIQICWKKFAKLFFHYSKNLKTNSDLIVKKTN